MTLGDVIAGVWKVVSPFVVGIGIIVGLFFGVQLVLVGGLKLLGIGP